MSVLAVPASLTVALVRAVARRDTDQVAFVKECAREIERRNWRIAELEAMVGQRAVIVAKLRLTPVEQGIAGVLASLPGIVTRASIFTAVYGARPEADQPAADVIDVHIHKVRKRLKAYQIPLINHHGLGWIVPDVNKPALRELLGLAPIERKASV